jgi:hypothetical protein
MHGFNLAQIAVPHYDLDMDTKVAILDGLANPKTTRSNTAPSCISGNCSFPSYNGVTHSSIGMCRKCVNITPWVAEVRNSSVTGNKTVSRGHYLVLPDETGVGGQPTPDTILSISGFGIQAYPDFPSAVDGAFDNSLTDAFDDTFKTISKISIFNVSVISLTLDGCGWVEDDGSLDFGTKSNCSHPELGLSSYWDHLNVVATACIFYVCVKNYYGSMVDNVFTEDTVSEIAAERPPPQMVPGYKQFNTPCVIYSQLYTVDNVSSVPKENRNFSSILVGNDNIAVPNQCLYGIDGTYALSVGDFLNETLIEHCGTSAIVKFNWPTNDVDWNMINCHP